MPASRAHSSSSGGAACPGSTRGQPRGSTPGVKGWFQGDLSGKNFLWRIPNTEHRTPNTGWTHRRDSWNSYVDLFKYSWKKSDFCQFFKIKQRGASEGSKNKANNFVIFKPKMKLRGVFQSEKQKDTYQALKILMFGLSWILIFLLYIITSVSQFQK